jgi:hypothetical protein
MFVSLTRISHSHLADIPEKSFGWLGRDCVPTLVSRDETEKFAIFLDQTGSGEFSVFECSNNTSWHGPYVSGVDIEVDPTSFTGEHPGRFGILRIEDGAAAIICNFVGQGMKQARWIKVAELTHPTSSTGYFFRWRVVHREGENVEILHSIDFLSSD